MKRFNLEKDIPVFCVSAHSFPEGIEAAHQKLHRLITDPAERNYFGISHPNRNGVIEYQAAAEEIRNKEGQSLGCKSFVIKKGNYACIILKDYTENPQSISRAFEQLLTHPDLDPQGYCLEWYLNEKELRCMVGIKP